MQIEQNKVHGMMLVTKFCVFFDQKWDGNEFVIFSELKKKSRKNLTMFLQ